MNIRWFQSIAPPASLCVGHAGYHLHAVLVRQPSNDGGAYVWRVGVQLLRSNCGQAVGPDSSREVVETSAWYHYFLHRRHLKQRKCRRLLSIDNRSPTCDLTTRWKYFLNVKWQEEGWTGYLRVIPIHTKQRPPSPWDARLVVFIPSSCTHLCPNMKKLTSLSKSVCGNNRIIRAVDRNLSRNNYIRIMPEGRNSELQWRFSRALHRGDRKHFRHEK
jgi:hypothetical protein